MSQISGISVILPSLNPSQKIITVIQSVKDQGFSDIIVINDGSKSEILPVFDEIAKISGCTVLHHEENKGKGAALKTGMKYFLDNRQENIGVITIDDDGQHLSEDIKKCAEKMIETGAFILGARDFSNSSVPPKSRFGNRVSAKAFNLVGLKITDSQTGLRAIPRKCLDVFVNVSGNRFEYETNMLLAVKRECFDLIEVPITVVYFEGNKATHFKALKDSFKVMFQFIKYILGSLLSWVIDISAFYVLLKFISWDFHPENWIFLNFEIKKEIILCTVIARVISSIFNYIYNRNIVFKNKKNILKTASKYFILVCFNMVLSGSLVAFFSSPNILNIEFAAIITLIKITVDTFIFIINYFIQKRLVFK